jgi:hypothetical protein
LGIWDEVMGLTARAGARQATREGAESGARGSLSASPRMLRKMRKRSAWDDVGDNVGAFFKGAGVLGKNVVDFAAHPLDNTFGEGNTNGLREILERAKPAPYVPNPKQSTLEQIGRGIMHTNTHLPSVEPAMRGISALSRSGISPTGNMNAQVRAIAGFDPAEQDLNNVLGSRGQELWSRIQDDAERVAATQKGKPFVQRAAEATLGPAAQYFDPNSQDVFSTAQESGYSPADSLAVSMLNPLEWLGSEGGAGIAAKLKNAGRARKVLNTVGRAMDPAQLALEGVGKVAGKAMDWKLPGRKVSTTSNGLLPPEEMARRTGNDPEAMRRYAESLNPSDAPLATNATEAMDSSSLWDDILAEEPAGDATRARIAGLVDEATPGYYDRVAQRIPDAEAPLPEPFERAADDASDVFDAPEIPNSNYDEVFQDNPPISYDPELDDLFRQAAPDAAEVEAGLDFQRQQNVYSAAKEAQVSRKLAEATPGLLGQDVESALRWLDEGPTQPSGSLEEALRASDPGAANPQSVMPASAQAVPSAAFNTPLAPIADDAAQSALKWLDEGEALPNVQEPTQAMDGIGGGEAGMVPGEQPLPVGAADVALPGSASVDVVGDVAAPGSKGTLQGGLRLYSNPLDPAVLGTAMRMANDAVGNFMGAIESRVGNAINGVVDRSPTLTNAKYALKRVFSENYGRASVELGQKVTQHQMANNAITRTATETIYHQLRVGTPEQRAAMQGYMNGTLDKAAAMKRGLDDAFIASADGVRYLMDDAGAKYLETGMNLERGTLMAASHEERRLMADIYHSFDNPKLRDNIVKASSLDAATKAKAFNLIDGAMARMEAQGLVKDGKVMDMGLDFGTWVNNLGKYEPQMYKLIEYGVDLHSPTAMSDFVGAIEARHQATADLQNELLRAQGKPEVEYKGIPSDLKQFLLARRTGEGSWSKSVAEEAGRFMKRKDLSQEMRDILGPMVNPAYTYTKGVEHVHKMENLLKMRRWAASHENLISRAGEPIEEFLKRTKSADTDIAYDFATNPQYAAQVGPLAGRFIHRDVADLMAATGIIPHTQGPGTLDALKNMSRTWLAVNKVIMNPASHVRQGLQNTLGVYQALGARAALDIPMGIRDVVGKSQAYLEARNAGLFSAGHDASLYEKIDLDTMPEFNFNGNELALGKLARQADWLGAAASMAQRAMTGTKRTVAKVSNKMGDAFAMSDDLAKLAAYKHFRRQGMSPTLAAEKASDNVFTGTSRARYDRGMAGLSTGSTKLDRGARNKAYSAIDAAGIFITNNPFFGATKFAMEQGARGLAGVRGGHWMPLTDPARAMRTYAMLATAYGLNELAKNHNGVSTEEDVARRPSYMHQLLPMNVMLPQELTQMLSGDGRTDWVDLTTIAPQGQMAQGKFDLKRARMSQFSNNLIANFVPGAGLTTKFTGEGDGAPINPLLKPIIEGYFNQDSFSGRPIYDPMASKADLTRQISGHLVRSYLPPLTPNPVGLLKALEAVPQSMAPEEWTNFVRAGWQGVAQDSGHQASKLMAAIPNSINFDAVGERVASSAFVDYRGRTPYLAATMADLFGIRIESRLNNEVRTQTHKAKAAIAAEMRKNFGQQHPVKDASYWKKRKQLEQSIREIQSAEPSLRFYEKPQEMWTNLVNALGNIKLTSAEKRKLGVSEDVT